MDLMQKLAEEAEVVDGAAAAQASDPAAASSDAKQEAKEAPSKSGMLLIAGCHEWDNSTSKTAQGLEGPHRIDLGCPVSKCFSSSSSCFSFFLLEDGRLFAMGSNSRGQLGVNDQKTHNRPVQVPTSKFPGAIVKVATGKHHSLLLLSDGDVYASGSNTYGQCGLGSGTRAAQDSTSFTKIPQLSGVVDIACGWDHSIVCDSVGRVYTFGHPSFGQLGNGTTGEYIKEGGKGAAVQFNCVCTPFHVRTFLSKDSHGRLKDEINSDTLKFVKVAAGKNHSVCVTDSASGSRVFSWGFGGYGRLGHRVADDEFRPREIDFFVPNAFQKNQPAKQVEEIICGSSFTIFITKTRHFYFCGMMSNSPRGEAQTYPKLQDELYDWSVNGVAAGSNLIVVTADDACVAWGVPVAGKIGLEGMAATTRVPKFVESVAGLICSNVSCGYGHVCFVVSSAKVSEEGSLQDRFPLFPEIPDSEPPSAATAAASKKRKDTGPTKAPVKKGRK